VSVACAERVLLPALRDADPGAVVLADGFSCRTQIAQGAAGGREALHLAELLRAGLHGDPAGPLPERRWARRPVGPTRLTRLATTAAVAALGTAAAAVLGTRTAALLGAWPRGHRPGR